MAAPPIDCKFGNPMKHATYRDSCTKCIDYQKELSSAKQENVKLQQMLNSKANKTSYKFAWRMFDLDPTIDGGTLSMYFSLGMLAATLVVWILNPEAKTITKPFLFAWPGVPFIFMLHMITFEKVAANNQ